MKPGGGTGVPPVNSGARCACYVLFYSRFTIYDLPAGQSHGRN